MNGRTWASQTNDGYHRQGEQEWTSAFWERAASKSARSAWAAWESRTRAETRCPTTRPRASSVRPTRWAIPSLTRRSATLARALMGPRRTTRTWWARRSRPCATRLSLPPSSASRTPRTRPSSWTRAPRLSASWWRRACAGCAPTTSTSTTSTESTQRSSPRSLQTPWQTSSRKVRSAPGESPRRRRSTCVAPMRCAPSPPFRTATP